MSAEAVGGAGAPAVGSPREGDVVTTPEGLTYPLAPTRLVLPDELRAQIVAAAREGFPNEACGLIAGRRVDGADEVVRVYALRNEDASPEHFTIGPAEQLAALRDMRARGLVPLGNWHSHPATPSRPSAEDIRLARDPAAHYLICSLAQSEPVLRAFRVRAGVVSLERTTGKED